MKKTRFTESQIVGIPKEADVGWRSMRSGASTYSGYSGS